jgi:hypothetical protein
VTKTAAFILIAGLFLTVLWACNRPKCFPEPNGVAIFLVDSAGNNLVGSRYNKDTIRLILPDQTLRNITEDVFISFIYSGFQKYNGSNYLLYLSKSDTDTLNLTVEEKSTSCGPEYHCTEFRYNSKVVQAEPNSYLQYKIVK